MGKNKKSKKYDPSKLSKTEQYARDNGFKAPRETPSDKAFDPSKEVAGWDLLIPFDEVTPTKRLRLMDALKNVNIPVDTEVVRASHIMKTNFTALAVLIECVQEHFVADVPGFDSFINGRDGVSQDDALGRTGGLAVSYALLLKKHASSTH